MIRSVRNGEEHLITGDPVRPHIPFEKRVGAGRDMFILEDDTGDIGAVICVRYCKDVPINETQLEEFTDPLGNIAVFYTVWSYRKGAGREIVNGGIDLLHKEEPRVNKFVTLSPLTDMAKDFHLRNGATLLSHNPESYNFEYSPD